MDAAEAGDFAVVAVPLKIVNDMPVEEPAGKIVLDTNNYMIWRDGHIDVIDSGETWSRMAPVRGYLASPWITVYAVMPIPTTIVK